MTVQVAPAARLVAAAQVVFCLIVKATVPETDTALTRAAASPTFSAVKVFRTLLFSAILPKPCSAMLN